MPRKYILKRQFLPYEKAREYLQFIGIRSHLQFKKWCKTDRPPYIPSTPIDVYATQWVSWGEFLGIPKYDKAIVDEAISFRNDAVYQSVKAIERGWGRFTISRYGFHPKSYLEKVAQNPIVQHLVCDFVTAEERALCAGKEYQRFRRELIARGWIDGGQIEGRNVFFSDLIGLDLHVFCKNATCGEVTVVDSIKFFLNTLPLKNSRLE